MSKLSLSVFSTTSSFFAQTESLLLQRESVNGLPLGIAMMIERNPHVFPEWLLTALLQDDEAVIAGVQTGVRPMLLAADERRLTAETVAAFARQLAQRRHKVQGVHAPKGIAKQFADAWCAYTGQSIESTMAQGVFELNTVVPPRQVVGQLVQATYDDTPLVAQWAHAFQLEALGDSADMREYVERAIHDGTVFKWVVNHQPVSIARWQRPLRNGVTISLVYTPHKLRRNGYASACVAALSQRMLDAGWQFCMLYTDANNPTSNKIYQQIGYRKVSDHMQYTFGA